VVGPPGIGKSRLVREVAAIARGRGVEVFTTFCESHATDVPFRVVAPLLRTAFGVEGLDAQAANHHVPKQTSYESLEPVSQNDCPPTYSGCRAQEQGSA
jgi:adenylate cyclase